MVFAVHLVHVLAMAVLLGGGAAGAIVGGSRRLEAVLWGATGALVVTGVGNVGAFGEGLPGAATVWGGLLMAKLLLVVALLAASVRRGLLLHSGQESRRWYHATAGLAAVIASLGVWLAHG